MTRRRLAIAAGSLATAITGSLAWATWIVLAANARAAEARETENHDGTVSLAEYRRLTRRDTA